jgi:hypothetical protein
MNKTNTARIIQPSYYPVVVSGRVLPRINQFFLLMFEGFSVPVDINIHPDSGTGNLAKNDDQPVNLNTIFFLLRDLSKKVEDLTLRLAAHEATVPSPAEIVSLSSDLADCLENIEKSAASRSSAHSPHNRV